MTRAEKAALEAYPEKDIFRASNPHQTQLNKERRRVFRKGYIKGQKDTIEKAIAWLKIHAEDYIVDLTPTYPDAPVDIIIGGKCWDELKKALED